MFNTNYLSDRVISVFDAMECTYEQMKNLMSDAASGKLEDKEAKKANDKIRTMAFQILNIKSEDVRSARTFRKAMDAHGKELFEVIEETIAMVEEIGWENDPLFMRWVEYKNLSDGDANEFVIDKTGTLKVAEVSGSHHDLVIQTLGANETMSVATKAYAVKVGADIRSFLAGRIDWAKLVNAVANAFTKQVKDLIYKEMTSLGAKLPASDMFNKSIQLNAGTKAQFDGLCDDVSTINGGAEILIVGTKAALRKVSGLGATVEWLSDGMKDEMYKTGRLGLYEGNTLVELPQRFDRVGGKLTRMLKDDELLILPAATEKFIKFVNEGDVKTLEKTNEGDYTNDLMTHEVQQRLGVEIVMNQHIGHVSIQQ